MPAICCTETLSLGRSCIWQRLSATDLVLEVAQALLANALGLELLQHVRVLHHLAVKVGVALQLGLLAALLLGDLRGESRSVDAHGAGLGVEDALGALCHARAARLDQRLLAREGVNVRAGLHRGKVALWRRGEVRRHRIEKRWEVRMLAVCWTANVDRAYRANLNVF